jgi:hypothetical protein
MEGRLCMFICTHIHIYKAPLNALGRGGVSVCTCIYIHIYMYICTRILTRIYMCRCDIGRLTHSKIHIRSPGGSDRQGPLPGGGGGGGGGATWWDHRPPWQQQQQQQQQQQEQEHWSQQQEHWSQPHHHHQHSQVVYIGGRELRVYTE